MKLLIASLLLICISTVAIAESAGPFGENVFLAKYKSMTLAELRKEMASDVPTRRGFVGEAIAEHGVKAWPTLKDALSDSDWRTRSSALYALEKMFPNSRDRKEKAKQEVLRNSMPGLIDVLTKGLSNKHYWVRSGSAGLLGKMGKAAKPAADKLAQLCAEEQVWVRTSAIEALNNIPNATLDTYVKGIIGVFNNKRTGFGDSRFAMQIIRRQGDKIKSSKELENALFHFVTYPGEGMWSDNLSTAIKMLVDFKADPKRLAGLFKKVLTDPLYEQRGAQRSAVCKEIVKLDNAAQFAPSLKKALAREKDLLARKMIKTKDQLKVLQQTLKQVQ